MGIARQLLQASNFVLLMCTNLTTKNIIAYCGMYYGTHYGGLECMFVDSSYLQLDDGVSNDEVGIVDIGGLTTMNEDSCFDIVDVLEGSSAPMDQALAHLHEMMVEIIAECTVGASIKLCNHATSLLQRVGLNIHHLCLAQVNKSMHPRMVSHRVDDGFENSIN
jgi:hypothetical protein